MSYMGKGALYACRGCGRSLGNYQVAQDNLVSNVRRKFGQYYQVAKSMSPAERQQTLMVAQRKLRSLPAGVRNMAEDIIARENARGGNPRGLGAAGAASTAANVANVLATVASIGISIHEVTESRKERKRQESAQKQALALEEKRAAFEMEQARQDAEMRRQQQALQLELMRNQASGSVPAGTPVQAKSSGGSNKALLYGGAAAAAVVAATVLAK